MTQGEALTILKTGANIFLTGEPGSGKTYTINTFIEWLRSSGISPSITAATGIAATHVGGMTIHSWSGIGIASSLSDKDIDRIASKEHIARRIQKAKVLIIEEISMLSATTFEMVDAVCREVRRTDKPFGGLTVILVGDFFQLPPISRGSDVAFSYSSQVWRELNPIVCYLTDQYRQDDSDFLDVLSAIRQGQVDVLHHENLMARNTDMSDIPPDTPKLFSHNADVDRINATELTKLKGEKNEFRMSSKGKDTLVAGLIRGCLSPEVLELKDGATVMFTKNSPQGKFVNGTLGTVCGFDAGGMPIIKTKNGLTITTEPMEWQLEDQGKVKASISQIPLRLAYAMTVHKSQGMSMDAAIIDLSRAFEYGQGYVALSRVRRFSGLYLTGLNQRALEVHPEILEKDKDFHSASSYASERFEEIPKDECIKMQKQFVKAVDGAWFDETLDSKKGKKNTKKNLKTSLPGRLAETLQATRDRKSLASVAKDRALTVSTIVKHLEELSEIGKLTRADFVHLVPLDVIDEIHEALDSETSNKLTPVFHTLNGRHSFETIRLVRLMKSI